MLKNNLKIALRNLRRDRFYAALNLLGLVIGITGFLLLARFMHHELTYDRFHRDPDQIYRLTTFYRYEGAETRFALVPAYLDPLLEEQVPEVEAATTLFKVQSDHVLRRGDRVFVETRGFYTQPDFGDVFTFAVRDGDPATMLAEPNSLVLTEATARKYFGDERAVGQTLEWVQPDETTTLRVTAVLADLPANSHLQFDFLLSGNTMGAYWQDFFFAPSANPMTYVYLRTNRAMPPADVQARVDRVTEPWKAEVNGEAYASGALKIDYTVQRLTDIYFNANAQFEPVAGGNITYVLILGIVALFMLVVAGINYVNLTTARALRRTREVSVRKVLGSSRRGLVAQFLFEAALMSLLAAAASLIVAEALLRSVLAEWLGFRLSLLDPPLFAGLAAAVGGCLGLAAGWLPAFSISRVPLGASLKGQLQVKPEGVFSLRGMLVTLQFVVTICLLTGGVLIVRQIQYLQDRGLGYAQEHVVTIHHPDSEPAANWRAFREALRSVPGVEQVGAVQYDLIGDFNSTAVFPVVDGQGRESVRVAWNRVDHDFLSTMQMRLVQGRNFSHDMSDAVHSVIVNEAALRAMQIDRIEDTMLRAWFTGGETVPILGVVQDFHFQSFNNAIMPVVLLLDDESPMTLVVRLSGNAVPQTLAQMEATWKQQGLVAPFSYTFLDDSFAQLIRKEWLLSILVTAFTLVSVLIACLGLIGLVGYVTEQKRKEIGIRKVLGASPVSIIALINRRFSLAVVAAFAIALPLAHWGAQQWLSNFAYRVQIGPVDYALAGLFILAVVVLTVSVQSLKAASADPVQSLRYE